ncbi:MAG TPA: hypothetical protein VH143_00945 [Kofleriaceae bacterium]|nr:hypothetical protein [Kofleriaceae bacterium]
MSDPVDPPQEVPPAELYPPTPEPAPDAAPPPPYDPIVGFGEQPLVPQDASLEHAVGAPSKAAKRRAERDDDRDPDLPRSRRTMVIAAASIFGGLAIAALIFLGRANSERYAITCESSKVTAEQGRTFPPWGTRPMVGPEWKQITLPTNAECKPRETESEAELGGWFLAALIDRASTTLTAKNPVDALTGDAKTSPLDVAQEQLNQALLLARSPDRRDERKEVERLLGDVDYWRASLRLRDASATLLDAAKQFETAAAKRPRHVNDAAAWSSFLRHLADELHAGPNAPTPAPAPATPMTAAEPAAPTAPMGSALPIEPDDQGSAAPAAASPPVPAGGVLL